MPTVLIRLRDWTLCHKTQIGGAFLAAWGWAFVQGCPDVLGVDFTQGWFTCEHIKDAMGYIGFFLVGGGYVDADALKRKKQELQAGVTSDRRVS